MLFSKCVLRTPSSSTTTLCAMYKLRNHTFMCLRKTRVRARHSSKSNFTCSISMSRPWDGLNFLSCKFSRSITLCNYYASSLEFKRGLILPIPGILWWNEVCALRPMVLLNMANFVGFLVMFHRETCVVALISTSATVSCDGEYCHPTYA